MRVMLDANVLISAFVFDSHTIGRVIRDVATRRQLVLCGDVPLSDVAAAQARAGG